MNKFITASFVVGILFSQISVFAQQPSPPAVATSSPVPFTESDKSEHFQFSWRNGDLAENEMTNLKMKAENLYSRLAKLLREEGAPPAKISIVLEDDAALPDGSFKTSNIDESGALHLYRLPGSDKSYANTLGKGLVHAFRSEQIRAHRDDPNFGFLEEGFAEFVSDIIEPNKPGFCEYGSPLQIAAGQWVAKKQDIPLENLFDQNQTLGTKCLLQACSLRASFISFLDKIYGRKNVMKLAYTSEKITPKVFSVLFKKSMHQFFDEWKDWLLDSYKSTPKHDKLADEYRQSAPLQNMHICVRGKDY